MRWRSVCVCSCELLWNSVFSCTCIRGVGWTAEGRWFKPPPWLTSRLPPAEPQTPASLLLLTPKWADVRFNRASAKQTQTPTVLLFRGLQWLCKTFARKSLFISKPSYSRATKRHCSPRQSHSKHYWPTSKHWNWASTQCKSLNFRESPHMHWAYLQINW